MPRRNRRRQGQDFEVLFLTTLNVALGGAAPPPIGSQKADIVSALRWSVTGLMKKHMSRLGQMLIDPEVPDSYESVMGAILLAKSASIQDYNKAVINLDSVTQSSGLTVPSTPGGGGGSRGPISAGPPANVYGTPFTGNIAVDTGQAWLDFAESLLGSNFDTSALTSMLSAGAGGLGDIGGIDGILSMMGGLFGI